MNVPEMTAKQIAASVHNRERKAGDVVEQALQRIRAMDSRYGAFLHVDEAGAQRAAEAVDRQLAAGKNPGCLAGVPVAIKDNMCIKDMPTTCASKILAGWRPPYTATVISRLQQAGAVVIGKTNMDEFAMGSSCENSGFSPTRNPWNTDCVPGGSSGGSAAAVAADFTPLALGSDTGGSIRQPAALCGVVGMKPTYGRVSRYGLVAFASSLDQIGPFARTAEDAALLLAVIAGNDPQDSTAADSSVPDYMQTINQPISGLTVGLPKEYYGAGLDVEVRQAVDQAVQVLRAQGAKVVEVSLPHSEYCLATYYIVATAEASSNLARYDGVQYGLRHEADNLIAMYQKTREQGFGAEVKRRIMLGTYALSAGYYDAYYKKALQVRTLIRQDFDRAYQACDLIVTPTAPTGAFKMGEKTSDPLTMYLSDVYTTPANLAGLPGISIPCGFTAAGLPIGLQLLGPAFAEARLLQAAHAYQQQTSWHLKRPA